MSSPRTQFARAGDVNVGFQVLGDGPTDLLWIWGLASNVETVWEEPSYAAFLRRLAEFTRVILYDRRGSGVSDREGLTTTPTLEERVEDALAVLDAARSTRASALGISEGGVLAAVLGATHPDRIDRLVIYGTMARFRRDAQHPWGWLDDEQLADRLEHMRRTWGLSEHADEVVRQWAPSMAGDERFADWVAKQRRLSVSRAAIGPLLWGSVSAYDIVDVFPAVHVPTLVLHRGDDPMIPVAQGRWIAEQIPNAHFVELPGADHYPFIGDAEAVLAEIEQFLVAGQTPRPRDRRLLTIMVGQVASSTRDAGRLGDDAWRELMANHDQVVRDHLSRFDGHELKRSGDGFVATFDGPARAIRCALGILDGADRVGPALRLGLHTGECDVTDAEIGGLALHVAARVAELAAPGEILASATVRDLVAGSGIRFGEAREVDLVGVAGPRPVCEVLRQGAAPDAVRRFANEQANVLRHDGEYWTVAYDGLVITIRDSKGMRDIARLLAEPGRESHVLDLAGPREHVADLGTDVVLDDVARDQYKRRVAELQEVLDDAEARGDADGAARARLEMETIVDELTSAYGLGGRPRRHNDNVERARKAVTRRIRDALTRIERVHPTLGRHLQASIRTGIFCCYSPERALEWRVSAGP